MIKRIKRAAILGCGPAGVFAAHALWQGGYDVTIFSKKRQSHMFGAQYLHEPIPGLPEIRREVAYRLQGTVAGYADKVYGPEWIQAGITVSPDALLGRHPAWDIRAAYTAAYEEYADRIINTEKIGPNWIRLQFETPEARRHWKLIISSIPAPALCENPAHNFASTKVWAIGDAPERMQRCPITCPRDTVICNGEVAPAWYRVANVFGHTTAEWPHRRRPPYNSVAEVEKPIRTDCDCFPRIVRVGRYGRWQKGYLSHQAYRDARKAAKLR